MNDTDKGVETKAQEEMPIKVKPFAHQVKGYIIVCCIFGFCEEVV